MQASNLSMSQFATREEYAAAVMAEQKREKPTVHYSARLTDIEIGCRVALIPIDHPATYLNGGVAYTSGVMAVDGNDFETMNTLYVYRPN